MPKEKQQEIQSLTRSATDLFAARLAQRPERGKARKEKVFESAAIQECLVEAPKQSYG